MPPAIASSLSSPAATAPRSSLVLITLAAVLKNLFTLFQRQPTFRPPGEFFAKDWGVQKPDLLALTGRPGRGIFVHHQSEM
jgi:hypothetical protein